MTSAILHVATLLVQAGACEGALFDCRQLDDVAGRIERACDGHAPMLEPWGEECARAVVVLWATESAGTFSLHPSPRHAYGPLQVVDVPGLTPPAEVMRWHPGEGFRAGVRIWRLKLRRARDRLQLAFEFYNGHPRYRKAYARRAIALYRRLQ